ncbi:MAG: hypothetical protein F6J96_01940 [Symploca sp. SIO1C2]|nr:hypothetical protein [Symploca sp. SIO1C2]
MYQPIQVSLHPVEMILLRDTGGNLNTPLTLISMLIVPVSFNRLQIMRSLIG